MDGLPRGCRVAASVCAARCRASVGSLTPFSRQADVGESAAYAATGALTSASAACLPCSHRTLLLDGARLRRVPDEPSNCVRRPARSAHFAGSSRRSSSACTHRHATRPPRRSHQHRAPLLAAAGACKRPWRAPAASLQRSRPAGRLNGACSLHLPSSSSLAPSYGLVVTLDLLGEAVAPAEGTHKQVRPGPLHALGPGACSGRGGHRVYPAS